MNHDFDSFTIWIAAQHVPRDGERRFVRVIDLVDEGIAVLDKKLDQVHALQSNGQMQNAVALLEFLVEERKALESVRIRSVRKARCVEHLEGFRSKN